MVAQATVGHNSVCRPPDKPERSAGALLRDRDAAATRSPWSSRTTTGRAPEHRVVVDDGAPHGIAAIRTATDGAEGRENPRP
jgi:hypothetical protein